MKNTDNKNYMKDTNNRDNVNNEDNNKRKTCKKDKKKRQKKTWFTLRTKKSLHLLAHNNEQYEQQIKQKTRIRRTTAARVRRTLRIVTTKQWEQKDQEEKLRTSRTTQVIKN